MWSHHTYDLLTSSLFFKPTEITSYTRHSPPDEAIAPGFVTSSFVLTWIIAKPATPPSHMDNRQEKGKETLPNLFLLSQSVVIYSLVMLAVSLSLLLKNKAPV